MLPYPGTLTIPVKKNVASKETFFIRPMSIGNIMAAKTEVSVVICGLETITEAAVGPRAFSITVEETNTVGSFVVELSGTVLEAIYKVTATGADTDP